MPSIRLLFSLLLLLPATHAMARPEEPSPFDQVRVDALTKDLTNREQIDFFTGVKATRCVESSEVAQLCEWNLGNRHAGWSKLAEAIQTDDRVALICELRTEDDARTVAPCSASPMRSNRKEFDIPTGGFGGKRRIAATVLRDKREANQKTAAQWIAAAQTMVEMSALLGAIPDRCVRTRGTYLQCRWKLNSRTYGHGTVATWMGVSTGKRVRFDCVFPTSGGWREEPCTAEVGS